MYQAPLRQVPPPHLEGEAVGAGPVDGEALLGAVELPALAPGPALRPAVETLARVPALGLGQGAVRCLHVHLLPSLAACVL